MKRNQIFERVHITSLWYGWVGITRSPTGKKILVKWALPDSIVDVKIISKKRSYATAHVVHVHEVDKKWIDGDVKCPHYFSPHTTRDVPLHKHGCGWCKWQIMSYDKQLQIKADMLQQCFSAIDIDILPIVPSPEVYGYRNKIEFSFWKYLKKPYVDTSSLSKKEKAELKKETSSSNFEIEEHWQLWFHKQWEFSKVVDVDQCYLISSHLHEVYAYIKHMCKKSWLPVYDAKTNLGVLRHIVMREWIHTGHIMVTLSYASEQVKASSGLTKKWNAFMQTIKQDVFLQEHITTFSLIHNNGCADIVRGHDSVLELIRWEWRIFEELHISPSTNESNVAISTDKVISCFQISPFSFFQTNTLGAEKLFSTAIGMIGEVKWNIIDLYCGSGTIGITLLKCGVGKALKGIEIVESAIYDAKENAKINAVADRTDFYCGKAEKLLRDDPEIETGVKDFLIGDDLVIVDPPRDGLHPKVVSFLIELRQQYNFRLLYISCNPTTLARDMALFVDGWYQLSTGIQAVDMFPQTHHVECITVLK